MATLRLRAGDDSVLGDYQAQGRISGGSRDDMVDEAFRILAGGGDLSAFGRLLHEGWRAKRSLSDCVSNSLVDEIYEEARSAGAIGGKLIGAGGGGFMLLFVLPPDQDSVRERLHKLVHVPFKFEHGGSRVIFFDPGEDYRVQAQRRLANPVALFQESTSVREAGPAVAPIEPV